jgi:hypothetical protein
MPRAIEKLLTVTVPPKPYLNQNEMLNFDSGTPIINLQTKEFRDVSADIDRLFLRCTCYMVYADKIYDLLIKIPSHQEIKVDSYVDKESYQVVTRILGL